MVLYGGLDARMEAGHMHVKVETELHFELGKHNQHDSEKKGTVHSILAYRH
jgi:hypothetical protein